MSHGKSRTPEYEAWRNCQKRCSPKFHSANTYYEKGIRVCDRWLEKKTGFINFLEDMGNRPTRKHSLDRIDVTKNYCKDNCRWATLFVQHRNRSTSKIIKISGRSKCVSDWCKKYNIPSSTFYRRIKKGLTLKEAIKKSLLKKIA